MGTSPLFPARNAQSSARGGGCQLGLRRVTLFRNRASWSTIRGFSRRGLSRVYSIYSKCVCSAHAVTPLSGISPQFRLGVGLRVAFFTKYTAMRASSRVRVFQYLPHLQREGIDARVLAGSGELVGAGRVSYLARAIALARWADVVVLQKPHQPPWFIDLLATINPRLVVDFTDAVWANPGGMSEAGGENSEARRRLLHAMARSGVTTVGSQYLASWARRHCPGNTVHVIPEVVDLELYSESSKPSSDAGVVLGWIGSPENLSDFRPVLSPLSQLVDGSRTRLRIVSSKRLEVEVPPVEFEPWSIDCEREAVERFTIGLMPLQDDERSKGRCGFKAVEYMAAGLPVVASAVEGPSEVVDHGVTGYLARDELEWKRFLGELISNAGLRRQMGKQGRERVEKHYSVQANLPRLVEVLQSRRDHA